MALHIPHPWHTHSTLTPLPGRVPTAASSEQFDADADTAVENENENERHQKRVWRTLICVVVANVVLFWLLTCMTAFARTANTVPVYLTYNPATGSYNYTLTASTTAGTPTSPRLSVAS